MTVLVTIKIYADVDTFRAAVTDHADELAAAADRGRAAGCIHHRFGIGDGYVLVIDEWNSAEAFQTFFSAPGLQAMVAAMGGSPDKPPEITVAEAIETVDQF